ncbi:hypothetical protein C8Q77DRAFT_1055835 [Trametes polyzona]|nr:hypothetical protein C8Q77DRAFT_1055835 [Trametes polyzona]
MSGLTYQTNNAEYGTSNEGERWSDKEQSDEEDYADSDNGFDAYLDHLIDGLAEEEEKTSHEESENAMHAGIHQCLQAEAPGVPPQSTGPCTIVSEMSTEFTNTIPGLDTQVFLLRDAKLFNRNNTYQGHMVVKIFPHSNRNLAAFTLHEEETTSVPSSSRLAALPHGLIMIPIRLSDRTVPFLLDTGSQVNCIRTDIWRRLGGVTNGPTITQYIANATGDRLQCHGTWRTTVSFGTVSMIIDLLIVDNLVSSGILGRPWQKQGRMWMEDISEGVHLGISSSDGQHGYGMLVTSPAAQQNLRSEAIQARMVAEPKSEVPEMDFAETHRISALMDGSDPVVMKNNSAPMPMVISSLGFDAANPSTWPSPWHAYMERSWYEQLLYQFRSVFHHQLAPTQSDVTGIDFDQAEKLALRDEWRTNICKEEELYLLRSVQVEVNGRLRRGHGVFQMVYFPEDHLRPTRKRHSSSSLELSDDEDSRPQKRARPTQQDLDESMEEIAYESTRLEAYHGDTLAYDHAYAPHRQVKPHDPADMKAETLTHNIVAEERDNTVNSWHKHQPWGKPTLHESGSDDMFTLEAFKSHARPIPTPVG